ncbi:hypothetical protein UlMin_010965 [Ulmus minor]
MNLVGVKIEPTASSLSGFTGDSISSEGILNLPVELGSSPCQHIQAVDFVLVDFPSPYNAIIGRPTLNKIRAVTSTYHLLVKFPTVGGIGILRGDQTESREIYEAANRSVQVQGIKSSAKSRDETPTTNIPNENGSVNNSEITKAAGIHGVNAIHLRDDVHCVNSIMIGTIEVKIDENAGATYQRLVNKMFKDQIGKTMEVYVDDMLVKSLKTEEHIQNLTETFEILRRYKMKLNPSKCAFGVSSGKFLGFMVNHRGIEANPTKIQALLDMEPPRKIKEVQRLTGRIAALNRFISRATDRCKPFFQALRKGKDFIWTADCEQSFQELKSYLGKPPLLSKPHEGDSLILYLAVSKGAVSSKSSRPRHKTRSGSCMSMVHQPKLVPGLESFYQVNSEFQAKGETMVSYLEKAKEAMNQFDTVTIIQVPRAENTNADALARLATGLEERLLKTVPIELLEVPSIDKPEQVGSIVVRVRPEKISIPNFLLL